MKRSLMTWDFRKHPVLWGICLATALVLAAYWWVTAPQMGTPLGEPGDRVALLLILLLVMALFAGVVLLLLWGWILSLRGLERRLGKQGTLSNRLTLVTRPPWTVLWGLLGTVFLLMLAPGNSSLWIFPLLAGCIAGALTGLSTRLRSWMRFATLGLVALIAVISTYLLWGYGQDGYLAAEPEPEQVSRIQADDPGLPGGLAYRFLTYGSGTDLRRAEYGREVSIQTRPVDASLIWQGYDGYLDAFYRRYWGFSTDALPLNGRVWLPEGEGPFPLVLIVHGNHLWNDFSDPGYAYLGEHLASRGYLAVSVDENFLNGFSFGDPGGAELPARGWLLLKHIEAFREWDADPASPFYNKVDLDRIALAGHSNGGEAVAIAAYFNGLEHLPGNTAVRFDFHFPIRAIVQLAPSDAVYRPNGTPILLEDIDTLLLQGAHDSQVVSLSGLGQYHRTSFSAGSDHFKSAVYFYRGNHVFFNTAWGRQDYGGISGLLINQKPVMNAEEQRRLAKSILTGFLEASLRQDITYRAWFRDLRRGQDWLPGDIYIHAYQDATFQPLEDFQSNNPFVQTACLGGMTCTQAGVTLRFYNKPQNNSALLLNWPAETNTEAAYTLTLQEELPVTGREVFTFSLAVLRQPANLQVEFLDRTGHSVRFTLDQVGPLHPALPTQLYRFPALAKRLGYEEPQKSETMFQVYEIPIDRLREANPYFEAGHIAQIIFHACEGQAGQAWLDEIGFRRAP